MQPTDFKDNRRDDLVSIGKKCWAYVPPALPPTWEASRSLWSAVSRADRAIGKLAGVGQTLANPHLLIRPFIRREAVLSSRIEGTQSDQEDVLMFEIEPDRPRKPDVQEVYNYVTALRFGLRRREEKPIGRTVICEIHERLLENVRGQNQSRGQLRCNQVWIGPKNCSVEDATFVPAPANHLTDLMRDLELFIHGDEDIPALIKLAMIHYQFEAIHPFDDGNGRIGRLLMTLLLCDWEILPLPMLYLSAYFEKNRSAYYNHLLNVSLKGEWEAWLEFFLQGVIEQSRDAIIRTEKLRKLHESYHQQLHQTRSSVLLLKLVDLLFESPRTTVSLAAKQLGSTARSAQNNIDKLIKADILEEVTGRKRNRIYIARQILRTVDDDIEMV